MVYLLDHKPARSQFRSPRRASLTGLTVIHTAESVMDTVGPDTGAENVAAFIARRSHPGSYHDLVDSDSGIQLVRYGDEAYQDGTGSNPYALSISFALRTTDWRKLSASRRAAFLVQGAKAFARQQAWLKANGYPTTPLRRVTRAQSSAGVAGFISHAERDPARRTDPGADFPWSEFFTACEAALGGTVTATTEPEDPLPYTKEQLEQFVANGVAFAATKSSQFRNAIRDLVWIDTKVTRGKERISALQELANARTDAAAALAVAREVAARPADAAAIDPAELERIITDAANRVRIDVTVTPKEK